MSRTWGCVHLVPSGEILGWYVYNGTIGVAGTAIYPTYEDMHAAWIAGDWFRTCACEARVEGPVRVWTDYGDGFGWLSAACLTCRTIIGPRSEEDADRIDVAEFWTDMLEKV